MQTFASLVTSFNFCFDPRLTDHEALEKLRLETERLLKTLQWKSTRSASFPLMVCLMGGTGTGKSTIFNSLVGSKVSEVGVRRPCTSKAILLIHEDVVLELEDSPYWDDQSPDDITVIPHHFNDLKHLILVDTPDFDSIESTNRMTADRFFLVSDILILITSQEKYGDFLSRDLTHRALSWGKKTISVMNKTISNEAYDDFRDSILKSGKDREPLRVTRLEPSPNLIEGLRHRSHFAELFDDHVRLGEWARIRQDECRHVMVQAISALGNLEHSIADLRQQIDSTNSQLDDIQSSVSKEMERSLDILFSAEMETQIRNRLAQFLRKYDILFVPRMMVRRALRKAFHEIQHFFVSLQGPSSDIEHEKVIFFQDMQPALAAARLQPLEQAIAKFNQQAAEFLSSAPALRDLCTVARDGIPRWNSEAIHSLYEQSFPGVEYLIEVEVNHFRQGLSRIDELKLYGSYTLWALLLVTVEIAVGGGFTLLDALLNTVIVPFIPPWLLRLKVIDLLREIAERVDAKHRETLKNILDQHVRLYKSVFSSLVPDENALRIVRSTRESLIAQNSI